VTLAKQLPIQHNETGNTAHLRNISEVNVIHV